MSNLLNRKLGKSDITVSAIGMGCWAIGGPLWSGSDAVGWGKVDDKESINAIHRAIDLGVNFFDTADVYGAGHSERILAKAIAGQRNKVIIASKFGNTFDEQNKQITGSNASPSYIREACEASLKRLNTDYIDLYQFHLNDFDSQRAEEVRDTLESLVNAGKIRTYGWSTDFTDRAHVFLKGANCSAFQFQMNVLDDAKEMVDLCEKHQMAGINRGPLAMGLLAGKFRSDSTFTADDVRGSNAPSWMKYFKDGKPNSEWMQKLENIHEILTDNGRTVVQGALAWILGRSEKTIPIPGFKTVEQVEENCKTLQQGTLTSSQMRKIDLILNR